MPITIKQPTFRDESPTAPLPIDIQVLDATGAPVTAPVAYEVTLKEGRMEFIANDPGPGPETRNTRAVRATQTHSGTTDAEGKASFQFDALIESFDIMTVYEKNNQDSQGVAPVGIYNPNRSATVRVDGAVVENGKIKVDQKAIQQEGLTIQIEFDTSFVRGDSVFFSVGSYYMDNIAEAGGTYIQLSLPPDFTADNPLISGNHEIFYGIMKPSGNTVVPPPTEIIIVGEPATAPLLAVTINNKGGEYINKRDDAAGVPFIIPSIQEDVNQGDQWELWYALSDPSSVPFNKVSLGTGTVPAPGQEITFTSPRNTFSGITNSPAWFSYTMTSQRDQIKRVSTPVRRIIDTN